MAVPKLTTMAAVGVERHNEMRLTRSEGGVKILMKGVAKRGKLLFGRSGGDR